MTYADKVNSINDYTEALCFASDLESDTHDDFELELTIFEFMDGSRIIFDSIAQEKRLLRRTT